ncbi:leucyl aminopeptidase family protein [Desulfohalovibrio reitneri]|uniref:leucyl aminopeptidase family protein n=1 Tax=Desulfohalovibrio reitneri TaxID=1307759 RepID=UPI00068BD7E0|nr:leucyl aminopeptidase family protein [Desulfohalovibrio reitneri]
MDIRLHDTVPGPGDVAAVLAFAREGQAAMLPRGFESCAGAPGMGNFKGKELRTGIFYCANGSPACMVVVVGLGSREPSAALFRRAVAKGVKLCREQNAGSVYIEPAGWPGAPDDPDKALEEAAVAAGLGLYSYAGHKSEQDDAEPEPELWLGGSGPGAERAAARARAQVAGVSLARDLANAPSNRATPAMLAEAARDLASRHGFACTVMEGGDLREFGCLRAVAQGSAESARFVVLDSGPEDEEHPLVYCGKGVTFDTGGISLKPSAKMEEMKGDMAGAAAVLGFFEAYGELGGGRRVVGLLPLTDNMPDGRAVKPGDVIDSFKGLTVEVINTDAEGRLILADALAYAERCDPALTVDVATLTGACVVALGEQCAGLFSPDDELRGKVAALGEAVGERCWPMPLWDEYAEALKSEAADVKNVGPREGGAIHAAKFLQRFAPEKAPWVHLDIAPTGFVSSANELRPKGGTGFGVRILLGLATEE